MEWATFSVQVNKYYIEYFRYFIEINQNYLKDLENTLFPLFIEIYGTHQPAEKVVFAKDCFYQAVNLVEKNDYAFYVYLMFESVIKDAELLKQKCREFGSKFRSFLEKYHLYNEGFSDV